MIGMREILKSFANVSVNDVVGMRAPFLKPGRNTQYKVGYCRDINNSIIYTYESRVYGMLINLCGPIDVQM